MIELSNTRDRSVYPYNRALVAYQIAIRYEEAHPTPRWAAVAYLGLADLYYALNQFDDAKDCYEYAIRKWYACFDSSKSEEAGNEECEHTNQCKGNDCTEPDCKNDALARNYCPQKIVFNSSLYDSFVRTMSHYGRWYLECGQNDKRDLERAVSYFSVAKGLDMFYTKIYDMHARAQRMLSTFETDSDMRNKKMEIALHDIVEASTQYAAKGDMYKKFLCFNLRERWRQSPKNDEKDLSVKVLWDRRNTEIEANITKRERIFTSFICEKQLKYKGKQGPYFLCLQRWNSYTPVVSHGWNNNSKGGGYFIRTSKVGVVIDPGFNFLENFIDLGYKFSDITHVVISHAHNDHTTDFESILTLLHQYNSHIKGSEDDDEIKDSIYRRRAKQERENYENTSTKAAVKQEADKQFMDSRRRKRLELLLSPSVAKKYSPLLNHRSGNADYTVRTLNPGNSFRLSLDNIGEERNSHQLDKNDVVPERYEINLRVLWAQHDDQISDRDSLGFLFSFADHEKVHTSHLLYTGDSGYMDELRDQYKTITENIVKEKGENPNAHTIILLAHLGSFKPSEYEYLNMSAKQHSSKQTDLNRNKTKRDAYYENHLGRLGVAKLVDSFSPDICLVSEFGEEFRSKRKIFTDILTESYNQFRKESGEAKREITFFPADIGTCISARGQLGCINRIMDTTGEIRCDFQKATDIEVVESESAVYYRHKDTYYSANTIDQALIDSRKDFFFQKGDAERIVDLHDKPE